MGKIAAQCAHAVLRAFKLGRSKTEVDPAFACTFIEWLEKGKQEIVYKVEDEAQLFSVLNRCQLAGALTTYIRDAGRTQVPHQYHVGYGRVSHSRSHWPHLIQNNANHHQRTALIMILRNCYLNLTIH